MTKLPRLIRSKEGDGRLVNSNLRRGARSVLTDLLAQVFTQGIFEVMRASKESAPSNFMKQSNAAG